MYSLFFFSSRRRHTRYIGDWSSDVCSSDLPPRVRLLPRHGGIDPSPRTASGRRTLSLRELRRDVPLSRSLSLRRLAQIGRASCRERVELSVGAAASESNRSNARTRQTTAAC